MNKKTCLNIIDIKTSKDGYYCLKNCKWLEISNKDDYYHFECSAFQNIQLSPRNKKPLRCLLCKRNEVEL